MKRLLSFILAAVMALSLMPISFATEQNKLAEEKTTDITLLYDMCKLDVVAASDNALSEITYAETGGFWRYHSMQKPNKNVNVRNGALQITKDNAWVAIGIYVPVAGEYSIELAYTTYRQHGAIGGMYILPGDTEDVATALANGDAYCVGSEISYIDTFLSGTSGSSKLIPAEKHYFSEGEHLIVYKRESNAENNGTTNDQRMYPGLITLKQGNGGKTPIGMREKQIGVGEKTKLEAYDSNVRIRSGFVKKAEFSSYTSSDDSVATVSSDGTVTGVGVGTATITALGSGYAAPYTVTVNVAKDRNLIVKYDLGGIIKSGNFNYISGAQRPITDITERLTNGFFRFSSASGTEYTTDADMCFHGSGSSQGHIEIKAGKWIEFEIYVPVKGTYTMNVHHAMYKDFGDMTVYVNGETEDGWKYSCHDNSAVNMTVYKADKLTDIELNAGWNKVKFEVSSVNSGSVGNFELVSGNGKVALLMGAEVTFEGDVAKVRGINSDGTDADISKATIKWKIDNTDVARIDSETGEIDNIHKGKANITVNVYIDDDNKAEVSAEYEVTVEPPPPMPFAGEENSSVISFIDISPDWNPSINENQGMSNATRIEDIRGITYDYTDGLWCWHGMGPGVTPGVESAMVWRYKGVESYHNRARFNIGYNKWVALKVKIPACGRYAVSFDYATFANSGGENEVYFVPVVPIGEVDALLTRKTRLGKFDYLPDVQGDNALLKKFVGNFEFEQGGEYLLVLKNTSTKGTSVYLTPRRLILDGTNSFKYVNVSVDDEDKLLNYNETTQMHVSAHLADGTVLPQENYSVEYKSTNENVLTVDNSGKITAKADGTAEIIATVTYGNDTYYESIELTSFDNTEFLGAVFEIPEELYVRETAKIDFYAAMGSGNKVRSMQNVKYEYSQPGIVEVLESGVVNALSEGTVCVTASGTFRGIPVSDSVDVTVTLHDGKQGPTIYTEEMRNAALLNIKKYPWAKDTMKSATESGEYYIDSLNVILSQLSNDGWPRSRQMGLRDDPTYNVCKYCASDVAGQYGYNGSGGWDIDMINRPFKVQCPDCKRLFPSNNFEGFFKLGFDENGIWSRQTALDAHRAMLIEKGLLTDNGEEAPTEDRTDAWYKYYGYGVEGGYLYNELYEELWKENSEARNIDPRTGDTVDGLRWGVDDSHGYYPGRKAGNVDENHCYIPYYTYFMSSQVKVAIASIATAYLYTGDMKYGRAGAILLDRFADIYPSYDIYQYKKKINWMVTDGGSNYGKILGQISDCEFATSLAESCDMLYPALNDAELIKYLAAKDPEKSSSVKIWENWENGILKEIFKGAKTGQIRGNFGSEHEAVATAAIAIDKEPETSEMIKWLYAANTGDVKQNIEGGELGLSLINNVDRDGMCNEASPYYLLDMWLSTLYPTAERLALYKGKEDYNLYENPKFVKLFTCVPSMVLTESHIVQIGDTGATAGLEFIGGKDLFIEAFENLKNTPYAEKIARYLWLINGKTSEGLRYGIFEENPESLADEIDALVQDEKTAESEMMAGFGFAVLRAGKNYTSASSATANNNQRDFWMYFGRNGANAAHGHFDTLNIGIEAFGLNLSPDIGYPANTGSDPQRLQWVSRELSHNTVMVNESGGENFVSGTPLHYDNTENVKLIDVDASKVYKDTETFRRSVVMIKVNDDVSYGIDFFRVNGGNTHTFSFHAQSEKAEAIDGVSFTQDSVAQDADGKDIKGSYAGADVPYGQDPQTGQNTLAYPRGYTWMYDVRRDKAPENSFTVDFAITDYRKAIADNKNIHLRVTQINNFEPDEVALTKGAVPARSQNKAMPEGLEYMIVQRRGENLDSLFTTVYEPYRRTRYIEGIEQLPVEDVPETDTTVKAVKVTHSGGERMDYIVYSTDNSKTYTVRDTDGSVALTFHGFVGVVTKNAEGAVTYRYVNDGDEISGTSGKAASYTGCVTGFEKELGFDNYIDVEFEGNPDLSDIEGRYINVANNATFNGAYLIKSVTDNREADGTVRLDIGDHTLINSYWDSTSPEDGFNFNIMEDQTFVIPTSFEEDFSPIFDDVSNNITTSAGSSVSVTVNAESPITENAPTITYIGTTLPRGASVDSSTGTVTWKPDASQIGENHFAITARDADGREETKHFTITVYGSTTGSSSSNKAEETDKTETPSTDTPAGGGGGGGGGAAPTDKPDEEANLDETDTSDEMDNVDDTAPDVSGETDSIRFTDLGNHVWAADAINTLAEAGIIKGTSEENFSPANNITRADFALLLVRAFKLTSDNTENFADVTADDYFATELAIARNNGIIGGIGDNKFAPRNSITRQDMMVIVYRALQKLNVGFGIYNEPENADFATVAPYARDAVSALIGAGLVNGKNGNIAPLDYTTRAEVAVLIKRILDHIK